MSTDAIVLVTAGELREIVREVVSHLLLDAPVSSLSPRRLATKSELAMELSCSSATVDRMVSMGMPAVRVGKTRRFDVGVCRAWCADRESVHVTPEPSGGEVRRITGHRG